MNNPRLYAPAGYDPKQWISAGCGAGKLGDYLVPDTLYGLSIKPACRIHDYMYHIGKTIRGKEWADRVFINNMLRLIEARRKNGGFKFVAALRRRRALKYYEAVTVHGGPAYWKGKDDPSDA